MTVPYDMLERIEHVVGRGAAHRGGREIMVKARNDYDGDGGEDCQPGAAMPEMLLQPFDAAVALGREQKQIHATANNLIDHHLRVARLPWSLRPQADPGKVD